jgi:hypothetical protein
MCEFCRYWTRHHPRDAAGHCELHDNGFMMEDDTCGDFDQSTINDKEHKN